MGDADPKIRALIVDMDGTLCDVSSIRHYVRKPNRDFNRFHMNSVDCPPNKEVVRLVRQAHRSGMAIVVVTARKAKYRHQTAWWLAMHNVPSDALFMRADNDNRVDVEVKRGILQEIRQSWDPWMAVDDNPSVIELWESEGIYTVVVPGWEDQ
jgi:phosphoglycolate phosphatase-like HAD superfamily hydrolase